ncbi:hypothetical protein ASB57_13870 [Bordetella sp. N]|nr:hypothetical protein ASB57_13870 [Bordetella sp. N]
MADTAAWVEGGAPAPALAGDGAANVVLTSGGLMVPEGVLHDQALHRAVAAHALAHLRHTPTGVPAGRMKAMTLAVLSLLEDARVERLLAAELPGLGRCLEQALFVGESDPGLDFSSLALRLARAIARPSHGDGNYWVEKGREAFERLWRAGARRREDYTALGQMLANDLGQMRVRMDPDHYVRPRHRDDDSWLWRHPADAEQVLLASQAQDTSAGEGAAATDATPVAPLEPPAPLEPSAAQERRGPHAPNARAVAPALSAQRGTAEPRERPELPAPGRVFHYPEWHHRAGLLRENWCRLEEFGPGALPLPSAAASAASAASAESTRGPAQSSAPLQRKRSKKRSAMGALRLPRAHDLDRAHRLRRQGEGETLDINAAIEAAVDRRGGTMPDPRMFIRPGRRVRSVSVLVLLDLSESANDRGQDGHSLLDRERDAALMLAAAAGAAGHRVAIHGFHSNTRQNVRYLRLFDFGQPLDAVAHARIDAQQAAWSTRLGAALRHATALLTVAHHAPTARRASPARYTPNAPNAPNTPNARRAILVITDGAPSDIDVHDSRHLVEDARTAIAQARGQGIACHCLAVDGNAVDDVRRMFGPRGHDIVTDPAVLPVRLARAFARLLI